MTDPHDPYRPANSPPTPDPNPYAAQPPGDPFATPAYQPPVSATPATFQYPPVSGTAPLPVVYPPISGPVAYPPAVVSGPVAYPVVAAPGGYDPYTGQPLSDKSKIIAGLLQLLPGLLFGLGGIGRIYAGQTALGVTQLALSVLVGWTSFWCGFVLFFPFFIYFGLWLWFVIDGIMLMAGRPVDGQGRLLRS